MLLAITTASAATKIDLWFIHRNGCPACAQMEAKLKTPQIAAILKRSFHIHRVERSEQNKLPKLYMHTHTFPTLYFLDAKGEEVVDRLHNVSLRELKRVLLEAVTVAGM
jgi:thioredoxin-related protein